MRGFIVVLDSFGVGAAPDATAFGDEGAPSAPALFKYLAADIPLFEKPNTKTFLSKNFKLGQLITKYLYLIKHKLQQLQLKGLLKQAQTLQQLSFHSNHKVQNGDE